VWQGALLHKDPVRLLPDMYVMSETAYYTDANDNHIAASTLAAQLKAESVAHGQF
jgi:hypothetical protein